MPLAKSAQPEVQTPQVSPLSKSDGIMSWEGVPIDLFRFFSVELGTIPQKDIS